MFSHLEELARFPIENHVIGSPETCAERVDWFRRELGVDYFLFNVGWGNMPHEQTIRSMERFATEVMPRFSPVAAQT
jgi:hypothetical protein